MLRKTKIGPACENEETLNAKCQAGKIPVRFKEEMVRNDSKKKVVFCKIQKK